MKIKHIDEKWSEKYKRSIDCDNPKGFSQRAHCDGRKKKESIEEQGSTQRLTVQPHMTGLENPYQKQDKRELKVFTQAYKDMYDKARSAQDKADATGGPGASYQTPVMKAKFSPQVLPQRTTPKKPRVAEDVMPPIADIAAMAAVAGIAVPIMKGILKTAYKTGKGLLQLKRIANKAGVKLADTIMGEARKDPMDKEVQVRGVGVYKLSSVQKNIADKLADLAKKAQTGDPYAFRQIKYLIDRGTLQVFLDSLIDAYDDLARQTQLRSKFGEAEEQELPIDMARINGLIQRLESDQYLQPEKADEMRRATQAIASGRDTLYPDAVLQLLTMVA
jgi:hypothetical protein